MIETAKLLFANDAFYAAFNSRDVAGMDALWARHTPATCIHPGWQALASRDEVMDSWQAILGNQSAPSIACIGAQAVIKGDVGLVICYEAIGAAVLAASNVFVREDETWRLIHHQAGPCAALPAHLADEQPPEPVQ
jgi:SnoaL-like protein